MSNPDRNSPCPCGSGKKYKKCCIGKLSTAEPGVAQLQAAFAAGFNALSVGQTSEAVLAFRRYLCWLPHSTDAFLNLGIALAGMRELEEAIACFRRSVQVKPDYAQAHNGLGSMFSATGQLDRAINCFERALAHKPDYVEAQFNLANAFKDGGRLGEACASYRQAIALKPDYAHAHVGLASTLRLQGKIAEALAGYMRALRIQPDLASAYSNLLFVYGYHHLDSPEWYLALARSWEQACVSSQDRQAAANRSFKQPHGKRRRLRIGYVSGDFRRHSVAFFVERLFAHHDRSRIELHAYPTHQMRDDVTRRINALADRWTPLADLSDRQARDRIEADGIDILVDLSGHTDHHRLGIFAHRAAPVQAHYLGYFASTGLTEMDYWIGDDFLTPPAHDIHFVEKVWRLPRIRMCYQAGSDAPQPAWRPRRDGSVWIGSFNNLAKITHESLTLWAKVLIALPEGRLLLKAQGLGDTQNRLRLLEEMAALGIPPERIELQDSAATRDWVAHMAHHDHLDIALDPIGGHGGATTTCEALWMGVPVITLAGERAASRMAGALVDAIGHRDWVAGDESDYIAKVVAMARDTNRGPALRELQRRQMQTSSLCDAGGLARALENAYEEMFEAWVASGP